MHVFLVGAALLALLGSVSGASVSFEAEATAVGQGIPSVQDIAVADVDLDGDLDVVSCAFGGSEVYLHVNQGDGTFAFPVVAGSGDLMRRPISVDLGDVDGDG